MNTTVEIQEQKSLPQLVKKSATYKLVVPEKVEEKIRYLLRKFPSTEWSGVLFITHEGNFEENNLVITCQDIYPMDLGNAAYTEFKMSEDVAAYMANNIELFDCDMALVHSHHYMSTTPSGTDLNTLREEGNERNCFVSLIVNNAGTYYAAITRKVQSKSEVTIKNVGTSYEFFGEGSKELAKNNSEITKTVDKEIIEYFDLEIERHEVSNSLAYLDKRFDEIRERKIAAKHTKALPAAQTINKDIPKTETFFDWLHSEPSNKTHHDVKEGSLFGESKSIAPPANIEWHPDPKKVHNAVCKILTCNLILNPDRFDLKNWVSTYMANVYERIFCRNNNFYTNITAFNEWCDFIIQFTMDYFDTSDVPENLLEEYSDYVTSRIAEAMYDELSEYSDANMYIQSYQQALESYIIE